MKGDYANGRIYKIEPICEHDENEVYYGSTCQLLCKRMDGHRGCYKHWLNGSNKYISSFILFEKYGIENCNIYLVELYPCETKEELFAREGYHTKNNKCVNKIVAGRTRKQHYEDNKEILLEQRKPYKKEYYYKNLQKIQEYKKQHYEKNKDKLLLKSQNYYQENKDRLHAKINCECGSEYSFVFKNKHLSTKKHMKWQNEQELGEAVDV
jgi:hypothetical protein